MADASNVAVAAEAAAGRSSNMVAPAVAAASLPDARLRPIETASYAAIEAQGEPGPAPRLQWIKIAELVVDDTYQRPLAQSGARYGVANASSRKTVRAIAEGFCWSKFSPVIVAPIEGGRYAIIDGQHRTTAAALRGLGEVPCQIVVADLAEQAAAFASINGNVTRVHTLALHAAAVAAGEPDAVAVDRAAKDAGVRIMRSPTAQQDLKPGDTMAVGTLAAAVRLHGEAAVTLALRCVTTTRHNRPGMLSAFVIRALAAIAAGHAKEGAALIAAVGRLSLDDEIQRAQAAKAGLMGVALWSALADRLRTRLRGVVGSGRADGRPGGLSVAPGDATGRAALSASDAEKAASERHFVKAKRSVGTPWAHIARQLGVGEYDLRRRHDPEFVA